MTLHKHGTNLAHVWYFDLLKIFGNNLFECLMFGGLVIISESLPTYFLLRSHKSTFAVTTLFQTFELTKLHMSIVYLITVIVNHLIE